MTTELPNWVETPFRQPSDVASWNHERYRAAVRRTWRAVATSVVAQIVVQEIEWSNRKLFIYPEHSSSNGPDAHVRPTHPPHGWRRGVRGGFYGEGTGRPDDATLEFTPSEMPLYVRERADSERDAGPGSYADEILMHELVHVLRCVYGRLDPSPCGFGFDAVDEFYAASITNMYAAERGRRLLEGHSLGFVREHRVWEGTTPSRRVLWEVEMLRRWRFQMPRVTWRLARLPRLRVPHNPFRLYARYGEDHHPYGRRVGVR